MARSFPFAELHAFPDPERAHSGNPAAVLLLTEALPDADLLGIAQSNNLAETAFLETLDTDRWSLRWFTPELEVDLCGHATLASAVWLFETARVAGAQARFETRSGTLTVARRGEGCYAMDFPAVPALPGAAREGVIDALNTPARPEAVLEIAPIHGAPYQMIVFDREDTVAALAPDPGALAASGVNLIVTAPGRHSDFVSRFFAPASGIFEDPVTGSAHCTLAPFWAERLGRSTLSARQIGPRPGALDVDLTPTGRVLLLGTALRFIDGILRL